MCVHWTHTPTCKYNADIHSNQVERNECMCEHCLNSEQWIASSFSFLFPPPSFFLTYLVSLLICIAHRTDAQHNMWENWEDEHELTNKLFVFDPFEEQKIHLPKPSMPSLKDISLHLYIVVVVVVVVYVVVVVIISTLVCKIPLGSARSTFVFCYYCDSP